MLRVSTIIVYTRKAPILNETHQMLITVCTNAACFVAETVEHHDNRTASTL